LYVVNNDNNKIQNRQKYGKTQKKRGKLSKITKIKQNAKKQNWDCKRKAT